MSEHLVSDGYKLGERDAMAWQVVLAVAANPEMAALGADGIVRAGYALTDAFLAERKRQQGEA